MSIRQRIKAFFGKGNQRTLAVKKNILGSIAIKGCSIFVQLLLVPMTLGYLSTELYGIWLTVSSIIIWLNFFDVGFTLGLKNRLSEAIAREDLVRGKALVSTTYMVMVAVFIPLGILLECIIPLVNWSGFLNVSELYNEQLINVIRVLVVCFCMQMIFNVITAVLAAFQRVALSSVFPVIGNVLACIVIYVLTRTTEGSLMNLALSISFLPILVLLVSTILLFGGSLRSVRPSLSSVDLSMVSQIFNLGARFFIIQIQLIVLYQSTNILISNIASPESVTAYNIAYKYLGVASMVFSIMLGPLWPAFTDAYVKKDFGWMKRAYHKMSLVYVLIAGGVIFMMLLSPLVYKIWIGDRATVPLLMTLAVGIYTIIHMWDTLQVMLINGTGCVKLQSYLTICGLVLHIPLSLLLGKYVGAVGVVCSMALINILYASVFTIQIRKLMSGNASKIWTV